MPGGAGSGLGEPHRCPQVPVALPPFHLLCVHVYICTRGFCSDLRVCFCRWVPGKFKGGGGGAGLSHSRGGVRLPVS